MNSETDLINKETENLTSKIIKSQMDLTLLSKWQSQGFSSKERFSNLKYSSDKSNNVWILLEDSIAILSKRLDSLSNIKADTSGRELISARENNYRFVMKNLVGNLPDTFCNNSFIFYNDSSYCISDIKLKLLLRFKVSTQYKNAITGQIINGFLTFSVMDKNKNKINRIFADLVEGSSFWNYSMEVFTSVFEEPSNSSYNFHFDSDYSFNLYSTTLTGYLTIKSLHTKVVMNVITSPDN
jgi:hypothetical protein